jgi:hypothetical protein
VVVVVVEMQMVALGCKAFAEFGIKGGLWKI